MRTVAALLLLTALLPSCGESGPPPRTRVLIIWDSVDVEQLHACGAKHDTTPVLSALAREGQVEATFNSLTTSATASVARHLFGPFAITSIREPGRDRVDPARESVAAALDEQGWRTIASVSRRHFTYTGLGRGFDLWRAPELDEGSRPQSAEQVFEEIREDLRAALRTDDSLFLFLHFDDLRGRRWIDRSEPGPWLETFLAPWRGEGGVVDGAFAAPIDEGGSVSELRKQLLRRRGDERRTAMLEALYAAELARLDAVLGRVLDELVRADRFESAEVCVVGGPATLPEDVAARDTPGARLHTARISRGWGDDPPLFDPDIGFSWSLGEEWSGVVVGRTGRVFFHDDSSGEVRLDRFLAQRLSLSFERELGDILSVTATSPEAELDVLEPRGGIAAIPGPEDVPVRPPSACTRSFKLSRLIARDIVPDRRGVDLMLRFALDGLREDDLSVAGRPFTESDLPVLLSRKSPPWSDDRGEPILDLRSVAGRRLELVVAGPEGAEVDLIVETFPPGDLVPEELRGTGFEVAPHRLRTGAVRVMGRTPLTVILPPRSPSSRLGIALLLDGERVASDRMRHDARSFRAPDELEIGLGAGVWIDPAYRDRPPWPEGTKGIGIVLDDPFRAPSEYTLPTPAERELLERLDENE